MLTFGSINLGSALAYYHCLTDGIGGCLGPTETKMTGRYALLALIYMISFVILFDRVHYKKKISGWLRGSNLMSREDLDQIQAIWNACQEN